MTSNEQRRDVFVAKVEAKMPRHVKRKRAVLGVAGEELGQEEYLDYLFPEEVEQKPGAKLLEFVYARKK